jgi:hypothetical protein
MEAATMTSSATPRKSLFALIVVLWRLRLARFMLWMARRV